tara:strand:- start:1158 stop:1364 length:207 start_codon:yes stop_codon:yes gene_type:complete
MDLSKIKDRSIDENVLEVFSSGFFFRNHWSWALGFNNEVNNELFHSNFSNNFYTDNWNVCYFPTYVKN